MVPTTTSIAPLSTRDGLILKILLAFTPPDESSRLASQTPRANSIQHIRSLANSGAEFRSIRQLAKPSRPLIYALTHPKRRRFISAREDHPLISLDVLAESTPHSLHDVIKAS